MSPQELMMMSPWEAVVANCLHFAQMSYCQDIELWSVVEARRVMSQDMFVRIQNNVFVYRREHFPVDPHLKYVHLHRGHNKGEGKLFAELTMLDFDALGSCCENDRRGYRLQGRTIRLHGAPLLQTKTQQWFGKGKNQERRPRTLVSTVDPLTLIDIETVSGFFNLLYGHNICSETWSPIPEDPRFQQEMQEAMARMEIRPEQKLELRQILSQQMAQRLEQTYIQDQQPLLALKMQQTQWLIARRAERSRNLRMTNQDFGDHVRAKAAKNPALEIDSG